MKQRLFTRITLAVPGAGSVTHAAELAPVSDELCTVVRIIELDGSGRIRGGASLSATAGAINRPNAVVPHPRTYGDYPDITAQDISATEFEGLWAEAAALFPELA